MRVERCALCGCVIHRSGGYAKPSLQGRSHASEHHFIAERFFGRTKNRPGETREAIFPDCPWEANGLSLEGQKTQFCYECHEEMLHNPVFLPKDIAAMAEIVRRRGLNEETKDTDREKIAGRVMLLHDIISRGITAMLPNEKQSNARQILDIIRYHIAQRPQHTASVLTGPAREGWFNSEAYVAINAAHSRRLSDSAIIYGEEEYQTVLEKVGLTEAEKEDEEKRPDLVGYFSSNGQVDLVIEAKAVYSPVSNKTTGQVEKLREQVDRARKLFPDALVLGVIYAVHQLSGSRLGAEEIDLSKDDPPENNKDFEHQPKMINPQVLPSSFFLELSELVLATFPASEYSEVDTGIIVALPQIQFVKGKVGPFSVPVSLGIGGIICL